MAWRCWPRAELGHPGLPMILQYSRGGTSSKFRGSVEGWMVSFSPSGTWYRSRGNFGHLGYRTGLTFEYHRVEYILSSSRCCSGTSGREYIISSGQVVIEVQVEELQIICI